MLEKSHNGVGVDVEVLVIGAGIVGIYALYRALDAGFTAQALEAGDAIGGVWHWNRYPSARLDSESYSYAYLFSKELFEQWRWKDEFATQPEVESYLNYVVDRFGLREKIHTGRRVVSTVWSEDENLWTVTSNTGEVVRARWIIAATGSVSVPYVPPIAGAEDFAGAAHHTGAWPESPIDFTGKRVAIIGNGPSGAQLLPAIVDVVESVDLYQRSPTWVTPLNNTPIDDDRHEWLSTNYHDIVDTLISGPSGYLHEPAGRFSTADSAEERQAYYEKLWSSPGFSKLTSNYWDMTTNREANLEFCAFLASKIRGIVNDPEVADKLIPADQLFGTKRPPFVTNYYESFNKPNASLISLKETPIIRIDATGIETTEGHRDYDVIAYATGFDVGPGALTRMGVRGREGFDLTTAWAERAFDFAGFTANHLPNYFFPGELRGSGVGNAPRLAQDQIDWAVDTMAHAREHGYQTFEPTEAQQNAWMTAIETLSPDSIFADVHAHFFGANVEGKPRRFLLNPAGRGQVREALAEVAASENYGGALSSVRETVAAEQA